MRLPIYLDHNATTPCDPEVLEAMLPFFGEQFGNASSIHHPYGWLADDAVEQAREQTAQLIGAKPTEIIFTSGATEAINLGIRGVMMAKEKPAEKDHIVTVATEHSAVLDTVRAMERVGFRATYLPVKPDGLVDVADVAAALTEKTALLVVMAANNETGVLQPLREIGELTRKKGVLLMSDAVQAVGKIPINVADMPIDLLALSAHKFYGPKGVGALYVRKRKPLVALEPLLTGGGHERGMRSGTLNVPGIVGLGRACQVAGRLIESESRRLGSLRDMLESTLLQLPGTRVNGNRDNRLPHVTNLSFDGVEGKEWLIALNRKIAVSSGSACSSITERASHVLLAMGVSEARGKASVRFGLGRSTTETDIATATDHIIATLKRLQRNPA
ncbi:MAG: cysteine desulfurase [Lunatimonas sp.]|uniref:cysteine desulfurase family protein n=1 Tax=Lunatimonas sp. TaxID=2060141 RepID=UPI00263A4FAC|nr:cysteine desulfurase family protein [Lunatimonas sp.]MCC5937164.1 cysteine desulfurase [Lunatimonas sp.]